jgi:hypothetical protein
MSEVATQGSNHAAITQYSKSDMARNEPDMTFGARGSDSRERRSIPGPYSPTPNIPITIPLISEIRPRHHTPALLGTGVPSVL